MKTGACGIALVCWCGLACWWSHNDWWLVGVVVGFMLQIFALAYLCDDKK